VKILIAGATGLVGPALVQRLSGAHSVHALARTPRNIPGPVEWHVADLSAPTQSWSLPPQWDATIYLAQSQGYREFPAQAADMVAVNVHAPITLLEASRTRGAKQFVLASTANVYGVAHRALDEQSVVNPTSFYARTRRAAEMLAEPFAEHMAVTVVRIFTVYGPGQKPDTLIASVIDRVRNGRPVQVQGERGLLLSPIYLSDTADALARLVEQPSDSRRFTVVNLAGNEGVGIGELASMVGRLVDREPVIERVSGTEPGGWIGDTRLLRSMTGWAPETTLDQGLRHVVGSHAA